MSKIYYLVKYEDNWADEMDVEGHCVLTEERFEEFRRAWEREPEFTFYVGTNEEIEYGYAGHSVLDCIDYQEISESERAVLRKLGLLSSGCATRFVEHVLEAASEYYLDEDYLGENYFDERDWFL